MAENSSQAKIKVNDRVKRSSAEGCNGVVKEIRAEIVGHRQKEEKEENLMVKVLWDNGTFSYFSPAALEVVKE